MERKEQTRHICRWMALGIMAALIIVGCTIALGLFEWRDRKDIARQNAELRISPQWYRCSGRMVPCGADAWYRL